MGIYTYHLTTKGLDNMILLKLIGLCLLGILALVILLLLIAVIHTLLIPSKKSTYVANEPEEISLPLAKKLSRMIQYETVSHDHVDEA